MTILPVDVPLEGATVFDATQCVSRELPVSQTNETFNLKRKSRFGNIQYIHSSIIVAIIVYLFNCS